MISNFMNASCTSGLNTIKILLFSHHHIIFGQIFAEIQQTEFEMYKNCKNQFVKF